MTKRTKTTPAVPAVSQKPEAKVKTLVSKENHPGMSEAAAIGATVNRVAKGSALVTQAPVSGLARPFEEVLTEAKDYFGKAFQDLSILAAMRDLEPVQLKQAFEFTKDTEDTLEETGKFVKARVKELALRTGVPSGEKGLSRKLEMPDGTYIPVTIQKTGTDPKKFEALLRAKNANPADFMESQTIYKMRHDGTSVDMAVSAGVMTLDEAKTCEHEQSYRVDRPKATKGEE